MKYKIGIWEEQSGYVIVEAKNKEEAKQKTEEKLSEYGIEGFKDFDGSHRHVEIVEQPEPIA